jgi:hypothetical protein
MCERTVPQKAGQKEMKAAKVVGRERAEVAS